MTQPPISITDKTAHLKRLLHTWLEKQLNYNNKLFTCLNREFISETKIQDILTKFQIDLNLSEERYNEIKTLLTEILEMTPAIPDITLPASVTQSFISGVNSCATCAFMNYYNVALTDTDEPEYIGCCNIAGHADEAFATLPRATFRERFQVANPSTSICNSFQKLTPPEP